MDLCSDKWDTVRICRDVLDINLVVLELGYLGNSYCMVCATNSKEELMDLDAELEKCLAAEREAIPDRVLSPIDGEGENLIILAYELGAACKDYIYSARSEDEDVRKARAANSITELQDVVCQALIAFAKLKKLTTSMQGQNVEQFIFDGLDRQQYRMGEVKSKRINYLKG